MRETLGIWASSPFSHLCFAGGMLHTYGMVFWGDEGLRGTDGGLWLCWVEREREMIVEIYDVCDPDY